MSHVLNGGGGQVFYSWRMCVVCCMASALKETQGRSCESSPVLNNQHVFRVQESVYRDGKQNR